MMKPGPRTKRLLPSFEAKKAAMMQQAREALAARRAGPGGDPFTPLPGRLLATMAAHNEQVAKVAELALMGSDDAHQALVGLIAERNACGEPLGPDLTSYADTLAEHGPRLLPRPPFRPNASFAVNVTIFLVVADLLKQFPELWRRRNEASEHPSAFSLVADVLKGVPEIKGKRGEEAIRKIWYRLGPTVGPILAPDIWRAPKKRGRGT